MALVRGTDNPDGFGRLEGFAVLGTSAGSPSVTKDEDGNDVVVNSVGVYGAVGDADAVSELVDSIPGDLDQIVTAGVAGAFVPKPPKGAGAAPDAFGFLAGKNPFGDGHVGAFGQSDGTGVLGIANKANGTGVYGGSVGGVATGVTGESSSGNGVRGKSASGVAVFGESAGNDGVQGITGQPGRSGVTGIHTSGGNGIFGQGSPAGRFAGDVFVTGTIKAFDFVVDGGDCAEGLDVASGETFDPGSVMVFDNSGALRECHQDYDRRVAGVISGAGTCHPGILLGHRNNRNRQPVALIGKVFCRVDANRSPVEVGDLLTTSKLPGHAMKAVDPAQAFGAVIGKAMGALASGQGLIPILVALQ